MKPQVETRGVERPIEIRDWKKDGFVGRIGGYAALYGVESRDMGGWREVIARGAFTESLKKKLDIRLLFQHKTDKVMARESAGTLRVSEDETGLLFEADLVDTTMNRDAFTDIRSKNLDAMSFGMPFSSMQRRWSRDVQRKVDISTVTRADVIEISVVTWAAYEDTVVSTRDYENFLAELAKGQSTPAGVLRSRLELERIRYR